MEQIGLILGVVVLFVLRIGVPVIILLSIGVLIDRIQSRREKDLPPAYRKRAAPL